MGKKKVYLVCDSADKRATEIDGCPNVGIEFMGTCYGRAVLEDGTEVGGHTSSSIGWLRHDLVNFYLGGGSEYEVIDLLREPVPERFRKDSAS